MEGALRKFQMIILRLLTVIVLGTFGTASFADYMAGEEAYKSGDYQKAYEIWLPAANDGDPASQTRVGGLFDYGEGVPEDDVEAVKWYRLAADQGYADAQALLGEMYHLGEGVAIDKAEAMNLYNLAIEQDNEYALFNLGMLYEAQARYEEAESLLKRYLAISEGNLGPDHLDIGFILIIWLLCPNLKDAT